MIRSGTAAARDPVARRRLATHGPRHPRARPQHPGEDVRQRSLFDDDPGPDREPRGVRPVEPAAIDASIHQLASALPARIRLGTSSWSFPGWTGLVYAADRGRPPGEQRLARVGLAAYARHPLLRAVSIDRGFYAALTEADFARYAADVPADFRFVVKAPAAVTDAVVRRGKAEPAGENPTFLDARLAADAFVKPALQGLGDRLGALVFQFPPLGRLAADPVRLVARVAAFLTVLPQPPRGTLAVEFRDPALADPRAARLLADAGAVPCLAVHARMPPVAEQAAAWGVESGRMPLVARWSLHAGRGYEEAKADYFPFDRLVEEDEPSRAALARLAAAVDRDVLVTINNKAEGSAPLSVMRLAAEIVRRTRGDGGASPSSAAPCGASQPPVQRCDREGS